MHSTFEKLKKKKINYWINNIKKETHEPKLKRSKFLASLLLFSLID